MINVFNEHRNHFQEQLISSTADFHYRYTRYSMPYSLAVIYISESDVDLSIFKHHLRSSDIFIMLQENLCAIVFDGANEEEGLKAAENLLAQVQNICFTKHLYMAIVTESTDSTEFQTVHDLFDLLSYALQHNMDNCVIENSQIMKND